MNSLAWAEDKALVTITLDLEMSRNFPTWEQTHWDYHKGDLDADTKAYTTEACRRVKARGGIIHCFAVGRVFEQESVDWLRQVVTDGHPVGNHTYYHVYVLARKPEELQFRFRRWPWLVRGRSPKQVIVDQIRMTNEAIRARLETEPAGFRSPGGFYDGLNDRPDVQQLLLDEGFEWVSTRYPGVKELTEGTKPSPEVYDAIVRSQAACQPYVYPTGLVEVPMSTISDIHAFRTARWKTDDFLKAIEVGLDWAIENRACYDFLAHPSCLLVTDPDFRAVELICDKVAAAGERAELVDLGTIARRAQARHQRAEG